MTNLLNHLEAARPTQTVLEVNLPPASLERMKANTARGAAHSSRPRHRRRRVLAAVAAVAATLTGVAVLPGLVGTDEAAAHADLTELAMTAARAEGPVIAPGTYLHVKTEAVQRNSRLFGDGETLDTNREQWVRWDGATWAIDSRPSAGYTEYHLFPRNDWFTPERAAELPDSAPELRTYLDDTVSGSNSHDEAVFEAITDWVGSNLLPPKTLAAALGVLAEIDRVETKDVTVSGRDAVEVSFNRFWLDLVATESMIIDRATARTISEHNSDPGGTYDIDTTLVEVVEEIPVDVRQAFDEHSNGERVYDDGHTPTTEEM